MYPILFEYKTLQISTYGLMLMIAFLVCNYLLRKYLVSINEDPQQGDDIIFYAAFGGSVEPISGNTENVLWNFSDGVSQ